MSLDEAQAPLSAARTLDVSTLDAEVIASLRNTVGPRGVTIVRSLDRVRFEPLLAALSGLGVASVFAFAALDFGKLANPTQSTAWILAYALGLAPMVAWGVRSLRLSLRVASMPFPPGVYITFADILVAHERRVRFIPLAQLVSTAIEARRGSETEIVLWLEGEPPERVRIPNTEVEGALRSLERLRSPDHAYRPGSPGADPLHDLKSSSAWRAAHTARPSSSDAAVAVATGMIALLVASPMVWLRNHLSDASAYRDGVARHDVEGLRAYEQAGGARAAEVRDHALDDATSATLLAAGSSRELEAFVRENPESPHRDAIRARWIEVESAEIGEDYRRLESLVVRLGDAPEAEAIRSRIPALALAAAERSNDAQELLHLVTAYPGTPEAARAQRLRAERLERVRSSLVPRARRDDVRTFLDSLVTQLADGRASMVRVRFGAPSREALATFDALVRSTRSERDFEIPPIASSFTVSLSEARETRLFERIVRSLRQAAPDDVIPLVHGLPVPIRSTEVARLEALERVPPEEHAALRARWDREEDDDSGGPEIRIRYEVEPTGTAFVITTTRPPVTRDELVMNSLRRSLGEDVPDLSPDTRQFAGFRLLFTVELRLPGHAERPVLTFEATPPPSGTLGAGDGHPSAETVYGTIADGAFENVGALLSTALFGE